MDLPQLSVVLSGVDRWDIDHTERVIEPRLIGAVRELPGCQGVVEFRTPPWEEETTSPFDTWANIGVPVYPFPRWLRCTRCNLLAPVDRERFQLDVHVYRPDRGPLRSRQVPQQPPERGTRTVSYRVPVWPPRRFPLGGVRPPWRPLHERTDPGVARGRQGQPRHRYARHVQGVRRRAARPGSIQSSAPPTTSRSVGGGTRISSGSMLAATNQPDPSCSAPPTPGSVSTAPHSRSPPSPATSSRGSQIIGTIWQRSIVATS